MLGYHRIAVDEDTSNLLVISTPAGRFRMRLLAKGVSSASDIITDGSTRLDSNVVKSMGDLVFFADNLYEAYQFILRILQRKEFEIKNKQV